MNSLSHDSLDTRPAALSEELRARLRPLAPRLVFGLRLAASVCLALYITYALELQNSFWAATTAAIVCQPNLGTSLQKGRWRIIGTIVGALAMIALLAVFAQQRYALALSLAVWCGACGVAVVGLRNFASYAAALAGFTASVVFADTISDPTSAFFLSLIRVSEICIGIGATVFVILLTDFGAASRRLADLLQEAAGQISRGFRATLVAPGEAAGQRERFRDLLRALGPLHLATDAAIADSSYLRSRGGNLRRASARLMDAVLAWQEIARVADVSGPVEAARAQLDAVLARLDARALAADPERFRDACRAALEAIEAIPPGDRRTTVLLDATRTLAASLEEMAESIALLQGARATRVQFAPRAVVIGDPLPAILSGVRVFTAVAGAAAFAIFTAWPQGPLAIAFVAIATLIFGAAGDQTRALAVDYTIGSVLMAVVGGVLYFGVLPFLSTFAGLATMLVLLMVPIGFMQAGSWHPTLFLAMAVTSLPMLQIGNPLAYDPSAFFNGALTIVGGTAAGLVCFIILPVLSPQTRTRRLLALSVRDVRRLAARARPGDAARWRALMTRRAEDLPPQASDDEARRLLALFALGRTIIFLRAALAGEDAEQFTSACVALGDGRPAAARDACAELAARLDEAAATPAATQIRAQIATLIGTLDALAECLDDTPRQRARAS
ncbi:FUSC family protein [Xanthobacter autotrophicus DSM 597]|uniref:FUSC family protein n=1 Tax=Xanthobacter wiegelii TaxID=3119913 RepID=UPI00372AFCD4